MKKLAGYVKQKQDELAKMGQNNQSLIQENRDQAAYINKLQTELNEALGENSKFQKLTDDIKNANGELWGQNKEMSLKLKQTETIESHTSSLKSHPLKS